jgi:hypothetical protein
VAELFDTFLQLIDALLRLVRELGALALHFWLILLWIAWWLWGVNWQKAWPILRLGAGVPLVLLVVFAALAWSQIAPGSNPVLPLPNFWWQLVAVAALALTALFCGWLQGVMRWSPADVAVDPPAHAENGHAHH